MRSIDLISRLLALVLLLGPGAAQAHADDAASRRDLLRKEQELERRIADLKREQDLLLFRRTMQQSDSKYLLLDLAAGTGKLKYRNRVLRSFPLTKAGGPKGHLPQGPVRLTEKRDQHGKKRLLLFGTGLVLQGKGRVGHQEPGRRYALGAKDLAALTYAIEVGAQAYIVRDDR